MSAPSVLRCATCQAYLRRRSSLIAMETVIVARRRGINAMKLAEAYLEAVHQRHLAGLSIEVTAA